jgi:hypothetical protein
MMRMVRKNLATIPRTTMIRTEKSAMEVRAAMAVRMAVGVIVQNFTAQIIIV